MSARLILYFILFLAGSSALMGCGAALWRARAAPVATGRKKRKTSEPPFGGLVLTASLALGWFVPGMLGVASSGTFTVILATIGLATVSWYQGRGLLAVLYRMTARGIAIVLGFVAMPGAGHVFQGLLPATADLIVSTLLWLWFIDLFLRLEAVSGVGMILAATTGIGASLAAIASGDPSIRLLWLGIGITAPILGLMPWTLSGSKLLLGDPGGVVLGYLSGWLLLALAGKGLWGSSFLLALYFLAEGALMAGDTFKSLIGFGPLPIPMYRKAMNKRRGETWVRREIAWMSLLLTLLAIPAARWPIPCCILGLVFVAWHFHRLRALAGGSERGAAFS